MDEFFEGIGSIVLLGFIIWGGFYMYQNFINTPLAEVNGVVEYDDCREKITLNESDYSKQKGTFVCNDTKTKSGKSMGGECIKTIIEDSGKCQTVYIYEKPAEATCNQFYYLTTDDTCVYVSPY